MIRQSISFTEPNDAWLKAQLDSHEFSSKSEVVNDLIRRARAQERESEIVRARLIEAEQSGFISPNRDDILTEFKQTLRRDE